MNYPLFNVFIAIVVALPISESCGNYLIWDRDYCQETSGSRLYDSILPPNSVDRPCEFEFDSNITLVHLNGDVYENLYRVNTSLEMSECDASNSASRLSVISKTFSFVLDSANFNVGDVVYYISTSNGTMESAEKSKQTSAPCLQLAFRVKANSDPNECRSSENCRESSILKDAAYHNFGCPLEGGPGMGVVILIYVGIPLVILGIVGVIVMAFCYMGNTRKRIFQRHSMQQEKTEVTSVSKDY